MAQARRSWAEVLRSAERGAPVEVTRSGEPVAVVLSFAEYRRLTARRPMGVEAALAWIDKNVDPADLGGPDPWADVRDRSPGRRVAAP